MAYRKNVSAAVTIPITIAVAGAAAALAFFLFKRKAIAAPPVAYPPDMIPEYAPPGFPGYTPPPEERPATTAQKWQQTAKEIVGGRGMQQLPIETAKSLWKEVVGKSGPAPMTQAEQERWAQKHIEDMYKAETKTAKAKKEADAAANKSVALEIAAMRERDLKKKKALEAAAERAAEEAANKENELNEREGEEEETGDEKPPKKGPDAKDALGAATTASSLGVTLGTLALVGGIGLALYGIYDGVQKLQKKFSKYKKLRKAYNVQANIYNEQAKEVSTEVRRLQREMAKTKGGLSRLRAYAQATA